MNLSEVADLVDELDLSEDEAQALHERIEARGVDVSDDCGADRPAAAHYNHDELATMTSDTLQLFLRDVRRHPLLTAERGGRARQEHRARRPRGEGADGQLQPAPGRVAGQEVPGPRARAARPDPGGHPGADPRRGEVRLAAGLQVLDLRDLLDPPGHPARPRQPRTHDPPAGAHRPARAQDRARRARAGRAARPPAHRPRGGRGRRADARRADRDARGDAHDDEPRATGRRERRHGAGRPAAERRDPAARGGRDRPARRDGARGARPAPRPGAAGDRGCATASAATTRRRCARPAGASACRRSASAASSTRRSSAWRSSARSRRSRKRPE